ncbi:MAG: hypothetical protein ACE5M4_10675 [Anaerolineales bacterium]
MIWIEDLIFVVRYHIGGLWLILTEPFATGILPSRRELSEMVRTHFMMLKLIMEIPGATGDPNDLEGLADIIGRKGAVSDRDMPAHWSDQAKRQIQAEIERYAAEIDAKSAASEKDHHQDDDSP